MNNLAECPVKDLIDQTSDAYANYNVVNADFAAFASMAIAEFKMALGQPDLTPKQLRRLLRQAESEHRRVASSRATWSSFMAQYVSSNVNENGIANQ